MKKIILFIIIVCLILSFPVIYQNKSNKTVLRFSTWGSQTEIEILKPILKDFEKRNPQIKVELLHIPQNYFQKLHLLFASNSAPDVLFINNLYLPFFANAGVLEPLNYDNNFEEKALKALSYDGTLYAIPRDISILVIYRNKNLFKKCSIKLNDSNWTIEDFLNTTKQFKNCNIFGISFETNPPLYYLPYLMSNGGGILANDNETIIFNSANTQKGLKFYADLRNKYHVAPTSSESANLTMAQLFLQQKLAMHLTGHWLVPKYIQEAEFEWDTITFPNGINGSIVPLDASGWAISKSSKNKSEAKKLTEFLSSKENIEKFTKSGLIVPARKDVIRGEFSNSPLNNAFIKSVTTAKPTPVSVNYNQLSDKIKQKTDVFFNVFEP